MSILRTIAKGFPVVQLMKAPTGGDSIKISDANGASKTDNQSSKTRDFTRPTSKINDQSNQAACNDTSNTQRILDIQRLQQNQVNKSEGGGDSRVNAKNVSDSKTVTNGNDAANKNVQ